MFNNSDGILPDMNKKGPDKYITHILYFITIVFWLFILWYALERDIGRIKFGVMFLGGNILIYSLDTIRDEIVENNHHRIIVFSIIIALDVLITYYMYFQFEEMQSTIGVSTTLELYLAVVFLLIVLYLTYDSFGAFFTGVIVFLLAYGYFGYLFPSWLHHAGLQEERFLMVAVLDFSGVYGNLNQITGTLIAPFLLFAGVVKAFGGFNYIFTISLKIAEHMKSGTVQTAIVASMLIGSINGSSLANTSITGSFTIPLMIKSGVKDSRAAAIESVASTGGQIMPPIMGAAAFIIASFLGRPYFDIIVAAMLPAFVFYIILAASGVFIASSDLENKELTAAIQEELDSDEALIEGTKPLTKERPNKLKEVATIELLFIGLKYIIPLGLLIYLLGIAGEGVMIAGFYSTGSIILMHIVLSVIDAIRENGRIFTSLVDTIVGTIKGMYFGAIEVAPLAIIIAAIGGMINILLVSGLPTKLALSLIELSSGILWVLLVLTMIICIILGMGMPTTAAYIIVGTLLAPSLIEFGVPALSAHFFVFYFAIVSAITPPIAVAVVVGSSIAKANFWEACLEAIKIAFPIFLIPFMFIYRPSFLAEEFSQQAIFSTAIILTGSLIISYSLHTEEPIPQINYKNINSYAIRIPIFISGLIIFLFLII